MAGEMRWHRLMTALAAGGLVLGGRAAAFHEEGVANCNGCHVTHTGDPGQLVGPSADGGQLIAESASDVCLLCHAERQGSVLGANPLAPPPERGPGNFVFLLEDNLNDAAAGAFTPIPGDAAGHNLVAPGHGLSADPRYGVAPGGSFPSNRLGCTSCHDPHGNDSYRMLRGAGPVMGGLVTFSAPAPVAVGIDRRTTAETPSRHNAYRSGMSEWCANCHGRYHEEGRGGSFEHPIDLRLDDAVRRRYNEYRGDADPQGGMEAAAYLPEVPFEDAANRPDSTSGPGPSSRILCLSCHRAHASSAPAAGRWDFKVSLLADDGKASGSYRIPDPYAGNAQGPLCLKCHVALPSSPDRLAPFGALRPGSTSGSTGAR
jgi:predicted CXXCH cytochrome family protein